MIDNKKIVDVAKQHSEESYISGYFQACYKDAFTDGAKWMQEEFLKDLWHPAIEEPKRHSYIMFKTTNNNGFGTEYIDCSWKAIARCLQITQWLYIDDLLPKKGGEQ
uniref:hypothetical protein n=1 Tax=Prevotella sp. TaxID=59823 RepID=UPI0040273905